MVLNRRINLIWYGRGTLAADCASYSLTSDEAKTKIAMVYNVTQGTSSALFEENTWSAANPSGGTGFTELKCGNVYVVVLVEGATIEIAEAVVVSNPNAVNPANITSVLPDNETDGGGGEEPVAGDCIPAGYTQHSIVDGDGGTFNINFSDSLYVIAGALLDNVTNPKTDIILASKNTFNVNGDANSSGFNVKLDSSDLFNITITGISHTEHIYLEIKTGQLAGCYKSVQQSSSGEVSEIVIENVDSSTGGGTGGGSDDQTGGGSDDQTGEDGTVTMATCFADSTEGATHKMIYTAPSDATSDTVVDFSNVQIFANGATDAIAKGEFAINEETGEPEGTPINLVDDVFPLPGNDNDNAIKLINDVMESAINTTQSKSKHSFCIHFSVLTGQDATTDLNVSLAATGSTDGVEENDTMFISAGKTTTEGLNIANVEYKVWVGDASSDANQGNCVDATAGGDGVSTFSF